MVTLAARQEATARLEGLFEVGVDGTMARYRSQRGDGMFRAAVSVGPDSGFPPI